METLWSTATTVPHWFLAVKAERPLVCLCGGLSTKPRGLAAGDINAATISLPAIFRDFCFPLDRAARFCREGHKRLPGLHNKFFERGLVHMAIRIDAFEDIEFEIPTGKDKFVTISLPPMDCWSPNQVQAMNEGLAKLRTTDVLNAASLQVAERELAELQKQGTPDEGAVDEALARINKFSHLINVSPNNNPVELNRYFLKFFNDTKAKTDAIDKLLPRYISAIAKEWEKQSGVKPGESEGSTTSSSETQE